jgi:hypothetical protein
MYDYIWFPGGRERGAGCPSLFHPSVNTNYAQPAEYNIHFFCILTFKTDISLTKEALPKQLLFLYIIIIIII